MIVPANATPRLPTASLRGDTGSMVLVLDFLSRAQRREGESGDGGHGVRAAARLVARPIVVGYGGVVAGAVSPRLVARFGAAVPALEAVRDIHMALEAPVEPALRRCPLRMCATLGTGAGAPDTNVAADRLVVSRAVVDLLPSEWRARLAADGAGGGEWATLAVGIGVLRATG